MTQPATVAELAMALAKTLDLSGVERVRVLRELASVAPNLLSRAADREVWEMSRACSTYELAGRLGVSTHTVHKAIGRAFQADRLRAGAT